MMWLAVVVSLCAVLISGDRVEVATDGLQIKNSATSFGIAHEREFSPVGRIGLVSNKADPKFACEEIIFGNARFQVLTDRIIRSEYVSGGNFNDKATFTVVNRNLPCVDFEHTKTETTLTIKTKNIALKYTPGSTGKFTADTLQATLTLETGEQVVWRAGQSNPQRLFGTIRTLDRVSGAFDLDCDKLHLRSRHPHSPVAQHCEYGIVSKDGWSIIDDSNRPLFDGNEEWSWVEQLPSKGKRQDWYLLAHGRDYKRAVYEYALIAGPQPIPPRFSFGVFYSRWWPWADWESINIIKEYEEYSVPLDVLVTDMDWHNTCYREQEQGYVDLAGQPACWTGWTWDDKYFPDPKSFMDWCHTHGIKNTLNLHLASGVQPWEKRFPQIAESMGLDPTAEGVYVEWNVTDKRFSTNFHKHILQPMEEEGVDFWWLDWQQGEGWFKDTFPHLNPTFYLNYVFFTQPAKWGNGDRPLILHRWGGLGNHRYPVGFSGDVYPNWESLEYQPYMTRESANVLFGYWSHDIGGFMEPAADELYLRWIQYGVFSPIFRTHGTRMAENIKRMWYYKPEFFKAMRAAMQWRARLIPYLYTAARRAHDTGISVCSPLYYEFPYEDNAYGFKTQYLFGEDIMVAPVVAPVKETTQLVEMSIWIPPGEWIELMTGQVFVGPLVVKRSFALQEIPLYVRSGAVIVGKLIGLHEERQPGGWLGRSEQQYQGLDIDVYLSSDVVQEQVRETRLYEDAGNDIGYQTGAYTWLPIKTVTRSNYVAVTVGPRDGSFESMPSTRYYRISVHGAPPPVQVVLNGEVLPYKPWATVDPRDNSNSWSFDGFLMAVRVHLNKDHDASAQLSLEFVFDSFSESVRSNIIGYRGKLARAQIVKHTLDKSYPETTPNDYDAVTHFAALGVKLSGSPWLVMQTLEELEERWTKAKEHSARFDKGFRRKQSVNLEKIAVAMLDKI